MCVCLCMYGREFGRSYTKGFVSTPTTGKPRQVWEEYVCHCLLPILPPTHMHATTCPLSQMHICTHITYTLHSFSRARACTHTHTSHSTDSHTVTHMHMHTPHSPSSRWEGNSPPSPHTPSIDPTTSTTKSLLGAGCGNEICGMHVAIIELEHKIG